jgi:hypothetical protein
LNDDHLRTAKGEDALAHPVLLFEELVTAFSSPRDPTTRQAALPVLAMLLLADIVDVEMLMNRVGIVFFETRRSDVPEVSDTVRQKVTALLADMRTATVLTAPGPDQRLTDFGRRVVLTGLRTRAMQGVDE